MICSTADRIEIYGQLDFAHADRIRESLLAVVNARRGTGRLLVDCSNLTFIDGAGLRALTAASRAAGAAGLHFAVINPSPALRFLLDLLGLSDSLTSSC